MTTLKEFMEPFRVKDSSWNLTGLPGGWAGKYNVPEDKYESFLSHVHTHVFTHGRACSLLEKHKAQGPILIDLDFRYAAGGPLRRRFTPTQTRAFVTAYADAVNRFISVDTPLQFYVMLKPAPEADHAKDVHKDGIHVVCPTVTTRPDLQFAIRGYLLQNNVIGRIFGNTGLTIEPQECFDSCVIATNNWFLYGACKQDRAWYKVETVYEFTPTASQEEVTAEMLTEAPIPAPLEVMKLCSIRYKRDDMTELKIRPEAETEWAALLSQWGKGSNFAKMKTPTLTATAATTAPPDLDISAELIQVSGLSVKAGYSAADIALAFRLVRECMDATKRAKAYHDWIALGLLLHNIAATDESLKTWAEISRRVPGCAKTADSVYAAKWAQFPAECVTERGRKPLMMGALHHWAKEDSPATYRDIILECNKEMAIMNDSGSHVSLADLVFSMFRHEFRCTPPRKGAAAAAMDWFQFEGHTWRGMKTSMILRSRLSNQVRDVYLEVDRQLITRELAATDQAEKERLQAKKKNIQKVQVQLQNSSFKDSVMKESAEKFYDEDFLQSMNQNPATIGFSNGVIDLRHVGADGQFHVNFRPGQPDDCISFQMGRGILGEGIPYIAYDPASPTQDHTDIMEFFSKIYPDPVLREYVLTLYASCLEGANREQKFYIMTGVGSNGKSKMVELMTKTFGEYQETIGTTALTRKRPDSGAANPDLVVLKCKRFVSMSEPDEGEKINTASMKQLSGEDTVKARALFQDQDQFVIMAKIFMLCNDLPPVSSTDGGTWRRLRVIPHVARFVDADKPTDSANHVYHKDIMLDGKISRWRPAFAAILVWYYEHRYLRGGLKEPTQVTAASEKYKEENDAFAAFAQECLVREIGGEVRMNDVLAKHKEWMRFNSGKKTMTKSAIIQKMTDIYGKPVDAAGRIWGGVRLAEDDEDLSGNS
uniref:SF3 helicase domain-containing protein n=1 Tax=viral metagenome TaxID=1070528 RepID=A0A6C0E7D5_9ZZZZ